MNLPLLVEADQLEQRLGNPDLLVVDLRSTENYLTGHVPAAVQLHYASLVGGRRPAIGLLPDIARLSNTFSQLGLSPSTWVVAYDDEGCGRASRLIWTLHAIGHHNCSVLNGGIQAWANEGHPLATETTTATPAHYRATLANPEVVATKEYVLSRLSSDEIVLLDTRTHAEYAGTDVRAQRGGHIPGAVNLDWLENIDRNQNLRMLPAAVLMPRLAALGITTDREIIVYCQTHHRSAHSYVMLRSLGYPLVRGYAGAWSEWGNDPALPLEV